MEVYIYINNLASSFDWATIPSIASAVSAVLMFLITYRIFRWDSKRDRVDYVPQLYLRSEKKPTRHPVFSEEAITDFFYKRPYQYQLVNISDKKVVDLEVYSEVIKDQSYDKLFNFVQKSKEDYIQSYDEDTFSYSGVLGDSYKSSDKIDLLDGNNAAEIDVPGSFHLALLGYNLMAKEQSIEKITDIDIKFKMSVFYNHAFSNKRVTQTRTLNVNFSIYDENVFVKWSSILFDQE